jgi:hypothetical protein
MPAIAATAVATRAIAAKREMTFLIRLLLIEYLY